MVDVIQKKKKTRRGRRRNVNNIVNKNDKWCIYHTNIRNLDSRRASLESILTNNIYSVVTINKTHFKSGRKVVLVNYVTLTINRVDNASGHISTSVLSSVWKIKVFNFDNMVEKENCDFPFQSKPHFHSNLNINLHQHQDHQLELWQGLDQDQDFRGCQDLIRMQEPINTKDLKSSWRQRKEYVGCFKLVSVLFLTLTEVKMGLHSSMSVSLASR